MRCSNKGTGSSGRHATRNGRRRRCLALPGLLLALLVASLPGAGKAAVPAARAATGLDVLVLRAGLGEQAGLTTRDVNGVSLVAHLPLGLLDRTGRTLYTATPQANGRTLVQAITVSTGAVVGSLTLNGIFSTRSADYSAGAAPLLASVLSGTTHRPAVLGLRASAASGRQRAAPPADGSQVLSALAYNGRWLALRGVDNGTGTRVVVLDTARMRVATDRALPEALGLDAITADGKLVYFIQSLPQTGYGAYQVRSYRVGQSALDRQIVVAPGETPGSMSGMAWTRTWAPDGAWLYTFYVQDTGHAFVHALRLATRQTRCLDFPDIGASSAAMAHFTLTVAPGGTTLYAVNPVLGLVVALGNLPRGVIRMSHLSERAGAPRRTQTAAAITPDGRTVLVATGSGVWAIDTHSLALRSSFEADQEVTSLALSPDGQRLYTLAPASGLLNILEPASGAVMTELQPDDGTWAIEGVGA